MIRETFDKMDHIKYDLSTIPVTMHSDAIYTSRILKSTNLPQPRNSNKVTIISNNHGNYLIYLIQCHNYCIYYDKFSYSSSAKTTSITSQFLYNFFVISL